MDASRTLGARLEPVIGAVYFAPEVHEAYAALGFDPSPGTASGVQLPDGPAYFCSRGACLGQAPGMVIASAFGVFSPAVVDACVVAGWQRTDAATIAAARLDAIATFLRRVLGPPDDTVAWVTAVLDRAAAPLGVASRPLYAGLRALPEPDDAWARLHRRGDLLREFRGDAHNAAWAAAGCTAAEIGLLTEGYWGLPLRTYVRSRGWTDTELDTAVAALRARGLVDDVPALTDDGRAVREAIEEATDRAMAPALAAIGDDLDRLCEVLADWGRAVRAAGGYLPAGPHDLAG